ncbi:MAG: hypothetical protein ACD_75C02408G0002 [uncultured bacterium]|nr:MAG: hypothetical protein ACD_75C02408G0002 [uncultured bacterium]
MAGGRTVTRGDKQVNATGAARQILRIHRSKEGVARASAIRKYSSAATKTINTATTQKSSGDPFNKSRSQKPAIKSPGTTRFIIYSECS